MAKQFTASEWDQINAELEANPTKYGFPERVYGSVVFASFNIRKLGNPRNRNEQTWKFLGKVCRQFDLIAVQEVMDELGGLKRLKEEIGPEFGMVVSDKTGTFPGDKGLGERLAFIFRWAVVQRGEVVSDITYDRSKVANILFENLDEINAVQAKYATDMDRYERGLRKTKPKLELPVFLSFIRQPFCVSFQIMGFPGTKPYRFMAINAHLIFGTPKARRAEFESLMEWIRARVQQNDKAYYPNFMLLGDLNLDFDNPDNDFKKLEPYLKSLNDGFGEEVHVNFPFLDVHPNETDQFTSNVKLTQRYDQIGLFFREAGLPTFVDNDSMGKSPEGPDFGVFNFTELFAVALTGKSFGDLTKDEQNDLVKKYHHKVSDHMPIWLRLPLPKA